MKRILVTGAGSYIGQSLIKYLNQWPKQYQVDGVTTHDGAWKETDFSQYDVVYHTAGIAHRKETKENAHLYYEINRDLAVEIARKAKEQGIKQFIFLSSISVYGLDNGVINETTPLNPCTNYGKSKMEAEQKLQKLADKTFNITILRPPMVYGKNCKGNFQKLVRLVEILPIFPRCNNRRSMIYIDNLSEFVRVCIDKELSGIFFPQNKEYVCTDELVRMIASAIGKSEILLPVPNMIISLAKMVSISVRKAFGDLTLEVKLAGIPEYCITTFEKSIRESL